MTANVDSNTITIFLTDELGGFSSTPVPVDDAPGALSLGDLDGDGFVDIVTTNLDANNATILLGDGTGNFLE